MPRFVMKVDPDRDHYVEWSTVVDNWCADGTRAEMLDRLKRDAPSSSPGHTPEDRLRRADKTGTSAMFYSPPFEGSWESDLMVEQRGLLPRKDLRRYLDAMAAGQEDEAYALLVPFEDD